MTDSARKPDVQHVAITCANGHTLLTALVTREYAPDGEGGRAIVWEREASKQYVEEEIEKMQHGFDAAWLPIKRWAFVDTPEVQALVDPDEGVIPYRHALRHSDDKGFHHDLDHARDIHRDQLREARAYLLADLDVAYMRAHEAGDDKAMKRIAGRKAELRDVTAHPDIEKAKTVEELRAAGRGVLEDGAA